MLDNVNLNIGDCDRMFIAARLEESGGKQKNINRFMFFEGFVRVAIKRYYQPRGKIATHDEAVKQAILTT